MRWITVFIKRGIQRAGRSSGTDIGCHSFSHFAYSLKIKGFKAIAFTKESFANCPLNVPPEMEPLDIMSQILMIAARTTESTTIKASKDSSLQTEPGVTLCFPNNNINTIAAVMMS